jgi:hypothetical protein
MRRQLHWIRPATVCEQAGVAGSADTLTYSLARHSHSTLSIISASACRKHRLKMQTICAHTVMNVLPASAG